MLELEQDEILLSQPIVRLSAIKRCQIWRDPS